MILFISDQ